VANCLEEERIKVCKRLEGQKRQEYDQAMQHMTISSFKDVPDAVDEISLKNCSHNSFEIEWKVPSSNNQSLTKYSLYLSQDPKQQ